MHVFLSYADKDRAVADSVRRALESRGFRVWSDEPTRPGESVAELIASGINSADAFVVVIGRDTASRQWSMLEVGGAIASGKPIVPVVVDEDAEVPLLLRDWQYLDLSDPSLRDERLRLLSEALRRAPNTSPASKARIELVEGASAALRREAEEYARLAQARERITSRRELLTMLLSVVAAATGLLFASSDASAIVAAIVAGLSTLLAATVGFYFGSSERPLHRGSDQVKEHR